MFMTVHYLVRLDGPRLDPFPALADWAYREAVELRAHPSGDRQSRSHAVLAAQRLRTRFVYSSASTVT